MNEETLVVSLMSLPFCVGMVVAFLFAKRAMSSRFSTISSAMWGGYAQANLACIITSLLVAVIFCSLIGRIPVGEVIALTMITVFIIMLISHIAGLVLYLPCAYLGCSMGARKKAEEEIARTQRQIIAEREAENTNPSTNDSDRKLNT